MKKTLSFITRIHRDLTLPLTAAAAFLLAQGCTPQKDVEDPQDNSIEKAAESLRSDPRMASFIQRGSEHLLALRTSLNLSADHNFQARSAVVDEFGLTHLRFDQTYRGVRIWESEGIVELSPQSEPRSVIHTLKAAANLSTVPTLSPSQILSITHADLKPRGPYAGTPSVELIVYPEISEHPRATLLRGSGGELNAEDIERVVDRYTLAYYVRTALENGAQETRHTDYIISAHDGTILKKWNTLLTTAATGTGNSEYSGATVQLGTNSITGGFELRDIARSMNIATYNLNHGTSGTGTIFSDPDNTWGDGKNYTSGGSTTNDNGQTAGVDAHYGTEQTFDYYSKVHGRNGIDGAGKATYNRVHYSKNYDNAFWDDTCFCMTYGDGSAFKVLTSIDVAGHEMTHGVTSRTANLTYSGESGGLNESMSDINGTMVEFYSRGGSGSTIGNTGGNWLIGDQLSTTPLRFMIKPSKDGASPNAWSTSVGGLDVHYSSGPMNRAFYFLSQGSSSVATDDAYSSYMPAGMTGITNDKAARIAFRALTVKMTSSTNYAAARTAFLAAATDLYGATSDEYAAVENAFAAINVGKAHGGGGTDTTAPTTSLTAPAAGTTLTGTVNVTANASDNIAVAKVEFYAGTTLIGSDTSAPYALSWNSATVANGTYALTSKAYDAAGNVGTSAAVSVTVSNMTGSCTTTSQLLTNADFEAGDTGWTTSGGVIDNNDATNAHSGAWVGWMNGYGRTHTDTMYQQVAIPATACSAKLSFWLAIETKETGTKVYDKLTVTVQDSAGTVLGTLGTYSNVDAGAYSQKTFDLAAYKGKTIRVHFKGVEDALLATSFFVDDAALTITQ